LYEALRATVIDGQPNHEGCAAMRFHGMVRGLTTLLRALPMAPPASASRVPVAVAPRDPQLIRLLANILLCTHAEVTHVY
jgi:hypothetical protein